MQINDLKLKTSRKKKKIVGRGGKKGTYCGRGMNGQKSRSGGNVNPLFEGGHSTLIDHMKKKRGFTSFKKKVAIIRFSQVAKNFEDGNKITLDDLVKKSLVKKNIVKQGVKIVGPKTGKKKFSFAKDILLTKTIKD